MSKRTKKAVKSRKSTRKRRQHRSEPPDNFDPPISDFRMMGNIMRELVFGDDVSDEPVDAAQQIMYDAWEAEGPQQQLALARKALDASPDCADAYVLLAERASTFPEAIDFYEQGVAAGARALGEDGFEEFDGHFWGFLETRPYMRARQGLAECLWIIGRRDEAVEHYREMLRLNPNDNQGIRYRLVSALLELEQHEEIERLLRQYEDDASAEWAYSRALLAFRQEGDTEHARHLLTEAQSANDYVPAYLTGAKPMPGELPGYITLGGEDEAVGYAASSLAAWKNSPGAIAWLRKTLNVSRGSQRPARSPSWAQVKKALAGLPQTAGEVWEVDLKPLATTGSGQEKPWVLLAVNADTGQPLILDFLDERPKDREVWQELLRVMRQPDDDDPHRPGEVHVGRKAFFSAWQSKLKQIGIACRLCDRLGAVENVLEESMPPAEMLQRIGNFGTPDEVENWPDIDELPQQVGEIWQAGLRPISTWMEIDGRMQRPWVVLVADVTNDLILATEVIEAESDVDRLWHGVHAALCRPATGEPHRPGVVQVASESQHAALAPHLEPAGIRCVLGEELDQVDRFAEELSEDIAGPARLKSLVGAPGTTLEQVGGFFHAAADFYRQKPWRRIAGDSVIEVRCNEIGSGPWYAVVMGQSGMTLGLALYEDLDVLRQMLTGWSSHEENSRRTSALSVTFGEEFEIAPQDLDAAEKHGWPIAAPEAYPSVMRVNPGLALRVPLTWELELVEACLRTLPDFLADETGARSQELTVNGRSLSFEFSRIEDF